MPNHYTSRLINTAPLRQTPIGNGGLLNTQPRTFTSRDMELIRDLEERQRLRKQLEIEQQAQNVTPVKLQELANQGAATTAGISGRAGVNAELARSIGLQRQAQILSGGRQREAEIGAQADILGSQMGFQAQREQNQTSLQRQGLEEQGRFLGLGEASAEFGDMAENQLVSLAQFGNPLALLELLRRRVPGAEDVDLIASIQDGSFVQLAPELGFLLNQTINTNPNAR